MNKVPDSFAPSPQVDLMWHVRNPNTKPPNPKPVDTQKVVQSEEQFLIDKETNKALFLLMKSSKIFFFLVFAPPYFLLIKLPKGLARFSFPLIKKGQYVLTATLKKQYEKIKNSIQQLMTRTSAHLARFGQTISNLYQGAKTVITDYVQQKWLAAKAEVNRFLNPVLVASKAVTGMIRRLSAYSLEGIQALVSKISLLPKGLKNVSLQIPKVIYQSQKSVKKAFSLAFEGAQSALNRIKDGARSTKLILSKVFDEAKNR